MKYTYIHVGKKNMLCVYYYRCLNPYMKVYVDVAVGPKQ